MNSNIQEIIFKLSLISKLKEDQSLFTKGGEISIYEPNLINWIWRKWTKDNKEKVVSTLHCLYHKLYEVTNEIVTHSVDRSNAMKYYEDQDNIKRVCSRLCESITASVSGLDKLTKTYREYPEITVKLECIVKDFVLPSYERIAKVVPVNDLVYNNVEIYKAKKTSQSIAITPTITFNQNPLYKNIEIESSPPISSTPISSDTSNSDL